jgi:hypothetical protein
MGGASVECTLCGKWFLSSKVPSDHMRVKHPEHYAAAKSKPNPPKEDLKIKVTRIHDRWHSRLLDPTATKVLDEMVCELSVDIGWCCREMLRRHDKMGGSSKFASAARQRQGPRPKGKVGCPDKVKDK